ncbi:MAG: hypothetical protein QFX32_05735 [Methanolinea sp.]|nr:hypothetical protein [Methanolinea sp.]
MRNGGEGRGWRTGEGGVPPSFCVCPVCGYRVAAHVTVPCHTLACPRCEARMVPG